MDSPSPQNRTFRVLGRIPISVVAIFLISLFLVGIGVGSRDLAGDELHMLRGNPWEIFVLAFHPDHPFTGHLPLSFWLRELVLFVLPDTWPVAWRLHSWLAAALTASMTCWLTRESFGHRGSVGLGLLLAIHPLMLFQGRDASNYALSALSGVALLAALHGYQSGSSKNRGRWLTLALCLGAANDYWFALPAATALGIGLLAVHRSPSPARQFRDLYRTWALPLLVALAIGLGLFLRGGSAAVLSAHADSQSSAGEPSLAQGAWRILNRLNGAALDGLEAGRSGQLWESLPPVAVTIFALILVLRSGKSLARLAAKLLVGSLGLALGLGMVLQVFANRALPMEPRSFMVLLPLLLLVWVEAIRLTGRLRSRFAWVVLFGLLAAPAWRQASNVSGLHRWASEMVSAGVRSGDIVVAPEPLSWRMDLADGVELLPCLPPNAPMTDRIWWVRLQDGSRPLSNPSCTDQGGEEVDMAGYIPTLLSARGPPEHERNAASFQPPVVVVRHEQGIAPDVSDIRRSISLDGGVLSGIGNGRIRLTLETADGGEVWAVRSPEEISTLRIPMDSNPHALRLELIPSVWDELPDWSLFDPYRRTIHGWEPRPVATSQPTGDWRFFAPAFGSPFWQVLRRVLRVLLLSLLATALVSSRLFPRLSEWRGSDRDSGSGKGLVTLGIGASIGGLVGFRLFREPMDAFGDSAAQYIDHLARLQALDRIVRSGAWDPLGWLLAGDGMYPPLLHILTILWSFLFGHGTLAVLWTGMVWLFVLAMALASLSRVILPNLESGRMVVLAIVLTPALHAVTTRYAYDLPMTALLWTSVAFMAHSIRSDGRRSWALAVGGGLFFAAAALVKWTALPFGFCMLLGLGIGLRASRGSRFTMERLGLGLGISVVIIGAFLASGSTSLGAMGAATFQPPVGETLDAAWLEPWLAALPEGVDARMGAMLLQLSNLDAERLFFYPARMVSTVFSPLLSIALGVGSVLWWRAGRPGLALVVCTVLGQWLFCLLLVPPLDDRFLLTAAPALTLVAVAGWGEMEASVRRWATPLVTVMAIWVAADFHLPSSDMDIHRDPESSLSSESNGSEWTPRLGLSSSIHLRGWVRSDSMQPDRTALRERLWYTIRLCDAPVVAGPAALLSAWGDSNWWAWRDLLERSEGGLIQYPDPLVRFDELTDDSALANVRAQLLLTPEPRDAFGLTMIEPDHGPWESLGVLPDPDGGPGIRVWQPRNGGVCPVDIAQ